MLTKWWFFAPKRLINGDFTLNRYDYPLFYRDIRKNAWQRVDAYMKSANATSPPPEEDGCSCGFACAGRFCQHLVVVVFLSWVVGALLLAPCHLPVWCAWHSRRWDIGRRDVNGCPTWGGMWLHAAMCCCCCPWKKWRKATAARLSKQPPAEGAV